MKPYIFYFLIAFIGLFSHQMTFAQTTTGPKKGSLMIIGGGRLDDVFYTTFMELAGGPDAPIVFIPTAGGDNFFTSPEYVKRAVESFEKRGFKNITVLHTRDPKQADSEAFVEPLKKAGGVWFMGGRQWRLADSYLNNRTHQELRKVLERGGVIAGTSAGATIQGSYLARGDTKKNTIMMGDHEEGLGFMTNVAIDQHLLARNRQFDMFEILENRPELLGIGLDENTGILVKQNSFEVMGASYVAIYDGTRWSAERDTVYQIPEGQRDFYFLRKGDRYDLKKRRVIRD